MQPVLLAEKPSQAGDYAKAYKIKKRTKHFIEIYPNPTFPEGAIITWAIGHLVELKLPKDYNEKYAKWSLENLPIIPDKFEYKVSNDKEKHYNEVQKILNDAETIIIGTDIDREGEAIARILLEYAGVKNKTLKRLWINTPEPDEVRKGMNNLKNANEYYNLFIEAQTRQHADWLVGMNLSPLYTLLLQQKGYKGTLSIGRVQSPTVYLIYQRQKEIENFEPQTFYEIEGIFNTSVGSYQGKASLKEFEKQKIQDVLNKHQIDKANKGYIESVQTEEKHKKSPQLHSLNTLQKTANKKWEYSPKKVLDLVQGLYDNKILSYPRSDSNFITESEFSYLVNNVKSYQEILGVNFEPDTEPKKRYVDNKKVEEHYAIIPTKTIPTAQKIQELTQDEKNIYYEVLATTLAMFHEDYTYDETTIITNVNGLQFQTKGKMEKNKGWQVLFPSKDEESDKKDKNKDDKLPNVAVNDDVKANVQIKEGKTTPPKYYTEGQLIPMMETCGKFVDDEQEVEILKKTEGIGTVATRGDIIEKIKKENYIEVKKNKVYVTKKGEILCNAIEGTLLASPSMTAKWETYLNKIGKGEGSQETFIKQIIAFINKMMEETPHALQTDAIKASIDTDNQADIITKCPSCNKGDIREIKTKSGTTFYSCTEYKNGCKFSLPKKFAGKALTKNNIKTLCEKYKTSKIKGFKSKNGKSFNACLQLDKEYKLKFDFSKEK